MQFIDHSPSADTHLALSGAEKSMRFGSGKSSDGNPIVCLILSVFCKTIARGSETFGSMSGVSAG